MRNPEEIKDQIAKRVVDALDDFIVEESEHYMYILGNYNESDDDFMADQRDIINKVCKLIINENQ
jgi:hypothetical protein